MHLVFRLLHCYAAKATSFHSSMCICDWESKSPKPLSSAILHRERANKVFGKRSSRLLACFFKFFITSHLPLRRTHDEGRHLNVNSVKPIIIKKPQVTYAFSSQRMSYLLDMLICVGMILLDNLLQCLLFVPMIDLSRTCYSTATLICNVLIMSIIYPWIKIKLVVLLFPTIQKPYCRHFSFMAGFVDALKPAPFTGANFKRLQMRITLWLTPMNVF
jgi:hypothetical protein